jgi:uncharacterized protein YihD (DUF1040 family)
MKFLKFCNRLEIVSFSKATIFDGNIIANFVNSGTFAQDKKLTVHMKKNNKLLLAFLCLITLSFGSQAQETTDSVAISQCQLLKDAIKLTKSSKSTTPLLSLIASGQLTEPSLLAKAYRYKGNYTTRYRKIHLRKLKRANAIKDPVVLGILSDYEKSIATYPPHAIFTQRNRYWFLSSTARCDSLRCKDVYDLRKAGYKRQKEGPMYGVQVWQGKDTWLGFNTAINGNYQPKYALKYT